MRRSSRALGESEAGLLGERRRAGRPEQTPVRGIAQAREVVEGLVGDRRRRPRRARTTRPPGLVTRAISMSAAAGSGRRCSGVLADDEAEGAVGERQGVEVGEEELDGAGPQLGARRRPSSSTSGGRRRPAPDANAGRQRQRHHARPRRRSRAPCRGARAAPGSNSRSVDASRKPSTLPPFVSHEGCRPHPPGLERRPGPARLRISHTVSVKIVPVAVTPMPTARPSTLAVSAWAPAAGPRARPLASVSALT